MLDQKIQELPALAKSTVDALIELFINNSLIKLLPGRKFGLDIDAATEIVRPIIDSVLGAGNWVRTGGNFFETVVPYRVHADTGKDNFEKIFRHLFFH